VLDEEMSIIKSELDKTAIEKKKNANFRGELERKIKYYREKAAQTHAETKEKERILNKVGYNEALKEEALKGLESRNKQKKIELKNLRTQIANVEGLPLNNDELRHEIEALKEEKEILQFSNRSSFS